MSDLASGREASDNKTEQGILAMQIRQERDAVAAQIAQQKKAALPTIAMDQTTTTAPEATPATMGGGDNEAKHFYTPYAEALKRPDLERLTGNEITTLACLYESTIPYQQYLNLRQKQMGEFSAMGQWYRDKKAELERTMVGQTADAIAKELHTSFVQRYRDMFYLNETSGAEISDPNAPGAESSTFPRRLFSGEALSGRFFDYGSKDKESQTTQLYALMELFDGVKMNVKGSDFTIEMESQGKSVTLLTGKTIDDNMEMSCGSNVLNDPELCDRALCLMVDQRKRLLGRTYYQQDNTFPIHGQASPDKLVRLYQLALIQNMNPIMDQNCMDSIIKHDQEHGTHYGQVLAHLMLIKEKAGKPIAGNEQAFIEPHKQHAMEIEEAENKKGVQTEKAGGLFSSEGSQFYLARRLQNYHLQQMQKHLTEKYAAASTVQEPLTINVRSAPSPQP